MLAGVCAPEPEVVIERLKMALAEAGFPDSEPFYINVTDPFGWPAVANQNRVGDEVWLKAWRVIGHPGVPCLECYRGRDTTAATACGQGRCPR